MKKASRDAINLHMPIHAIYTILMLLEIWSATEINFFILGYLLPFYPTNSLKNQNFEKVKKTPGDIPGETPFYSCVLQMTIM